MSRPRPHPEPRGCIVRDTAAGKLTVNGTNYVTPECRPICLALAHAAFGRVLELGYGMGITHGELHQQSVVTGIAVVERQRALAHEIACGCQVFGCDVRELIRRPPAGTFDTVVWDIDDDELLRSAPFGGLLAAVRYRRLVATSFEKLDESSRHFDGSMWLTVVDY